MIALTHTLLPEPVVPAMSRWGMPPRSAAMGCAGDVLPQTDAQRRP